LSYNPEDLIVLSGPNKGCIDDQELAWIGAHAEQAEIDKSKKLGFFVNWLLFYASDEDYGGISLKDHTIESVEEAGDRAVCDEVYLRAERLALALGTTASRANRYAWDAKTEFIRTRSQLCEDRFKQALYDKYESEDYDGFEDLVA